MKRIFNILQDTKTTDSFIWYFKWLGIIKLTMISRSNGKNWFSITNQKNKNIGYSNVVYSKDLDHFT